MRSEGYERRAKWRIEGEVKLREDAKIIESLHHSSKKEF
jgi:hypothetical protein